MIELLIQKLCHRDELSEAEKNALRGLAVQAKDFARGEELVAFGDTPNVSQLLVSGFVCRTRFMAGGDRQILAVHVPGDFVDLQSFLLKRMDHSVVALAPTKVAIFPHDGLTRITEEFPHLARMLWLSTLIDAAIHREWLLSLGRQSALQRTAHFLCELCARLEVVDKPRDGRFDLPLTQTDLSDVLGLSPVHVNRTVQDLRARKLIEWEHRTVVILDWDGLCELGEFDPIYLHLDRQPR